MTPGFLFCNTRAGRIFAIAAAVLIMRRAAGEARSSLATHPQSHPKISPSPLSQRGVKSEENTSPFEKGGQGDLSALAAAEKSAALALPSIASRANASADARTVAMTTTIC
jgi:hypothetical protein